MSLDKYSHRTLVILLNYYDSKKAVTLALSIEGGYIPTS